MSTRTDRAIPDIAMMALVGLVSGEDLRVHDGDLHLLTGGEYLWVGVEVLDLLEIAGWAFTPQLPPGAEPGTLREALPTQSGRAALARWLGKKCPGRKVRVGKLRPAKLSVSRRNR